MDKRQAKKNEKKQQENLVKKSAKTTEVKADNKTSETTKVVKKEVEEKAPEKATVYSLTTISYTLISAMLVVLAMIMWGKPGYYYLQSVFGKTLGYDQLDFIYEVNLEAATPKYVGIFFILIGVIYVVNTILSIVMSSKVVNATNKPYPAISFVCFLLTLVPIVLFFVAANELQVKFDQLELAEMGEMKKCFGIYYGMMFGVIVNAVAALAQMIMTFINAKIWEKTGKVR